jgi:small subunit ribosomal protein S2
MNRKSEGATVMAVPTFTMRQLLEAGVHFGHTTRRWNPKMKPFIFGERNGDSHHRPGTDRPDADPRAWRKSAAFRLPAAGCCSWAPSARRRAIVAEIRGLKCGQYFVNHRWLGGMLTNWKTITNSIKRLKALEVAVRRRSQPAGSDQARTSSAWSASARSLTVPLAASRTCRNLPDLIFVIDTNKESIAIKEARNLNIPVVAVIDSNSDPDGVQFPIPGNDDAMRAIEPLLRSGRRRGAGRSSAIDVEVRRRSGRVGRKRGWKNRR